jgi:MEKHLA domain
MAVFMSTARDKTIIRHHMAPGIDSEVFRLLATSYNRLLGKPLVPHELSIEKAPAWLYEDAQFGVLAHDTAKDPVFFYGNKYAQQLFEYDWNELTTLPSRLSAEAPERGEREAFLEQVGRDGFVTDYAGIRVTKSKRRFRIERATVWQLVDEQGSYRGQAAMIPQVTFIDE